MRMGTPAMIGDLFSARKGMRGVVGKVLRRFSSSPLAVQCRLLTDSGLFDRAFYKRSYSHGDSKRIEPVVDYLLQGGFEGRRPNPIFDSAYYLAIYPDVRAAGVNPLVHYVLIGAAEGRSPSP